MTFSNQVSAVLGELYEVLVAKNESYGNSALDPIRIFSKAEPEEQLRVRIDDKLSRLSHGSDFNDEDTVLDLLGYLILLRIAQGKTTPKYAKEAE